MMVKSCWAFFPFGFVCSQRCFACRNYLYSLAFLLTPSAARIGWCMACFDLLYFWFALTPLIYSSLSTSNPRRVCVRTGIRQVQPRYWDWTSYM